ncbi:MAG: AAA family ATPase [Saprospiraceae bacterium]
MDNTFDDIKLMLKANYPLLYLTTAEYNRITQKLRSVAFRMEYHFHSWDCVSGLKTHQRKSQSHKLEKVKKHQKHGETKDYIGFLEYLQHIENDNKEIFLMEDFHKYFSESEVIVHLRKLSTIFRYKNKHLVLLSPFFKLPSELEKYITIINVPLPDKFDLKKRLNQILKGHQININEDLKQVLIGAALGLTDTEADLAFRLAMEKTGLESADAVRVIANEKQQIIKKSGLLDYYQVSEDLDKSVGGLQNLKTWLKLRQKAFEPNAKRIFKKPLPEPKGILLLGVPGCGKSLTAKCIASLWKQPLLRLDIGKIFQAEVGSSEHNIRQAIATAEAVAPCVLWIDEIEKGLNVGSGEKDGGTNSRVFSTILTWMQEKTKSVFLVATANDISQLPPELLRKGRFDEIFFVDLPTHEERKNIFKIHLEKYGQNTISDYKYLAEQSQYFNGAEIEEVVKEALFLSYIEDDNSSQISIKHLEKAIEPLVPLSQTMSNKINKLRNWASTRARLASENKNNEDLIETSKSDIPKTKRERNEDIF